MTDHGVVVARGTVEQSFELSDLIPGAKASLSIFGSRTTRRYDSGLDTTTEWWTAVIHDEDRYQGDEVTLAEADTQAGLIAKLAAVVGWFAGLAIPLATKLDVQAAVRQYDDEEVIKQRIQHEMEGQITETELWEAHAEAAELAKRVGQHQLEAPGMSLSFSNVLKGGENRASSE